MRWGVLGGGVVLAAVAAASSTVAPARAQDLPDPTHITTAVLRQVCDLQWIEGACEGSGYPDPQYRTDTDPSAAQPYAVRIGVVHEHSGYSDGDPDTQPADYFRAAREGHNDTGDGGDSGVIIDFLISSEHSDNEKLPITTAAVCIDPSSIPDGLATLDLEGILPPLKCSNVDQPDHYDKWAQTMAQAIEATEYSVEDGFTGFTAMRGFEWTNDYFNHMNVYFSQNVVNAKIDGSYVAMDAMWRWLQEPVAKGGGADALVVFNHPGGMPALTPFDGGLPHGELLQTLKGGANWDDVAYVPAVADRVVGMEVNGGDDLAWFVKALTNGWHLGPVAAEDEHEREWSTTTDGKTLMLTRGRSPRDYYYALANRQTAAVHRELLSGAPGTPVQYPAIHYWADGSDIQDPSATVLGHTIAAVGPHSLELDISGLPEGTVAVLVNSVGAPVPVGIAGADGRIRASHSATSPATGESWWFAVLCPPSTADCGTGETYHAVTAPIWLSSGAPAAPVEVDEVISPAPAAPVEAAGSVQGGATRRLPATGTSVAMGLAAALAALGVVLAALRRRSV